MTKQEDRVLLIGVSMKTVYAFDSFSSLGNLS